MAGDKLLTLTKENFKSAVLDASKPVLVDFWAPWCSPCRMIAPVIEELAVEYLEKVQVGKVNVDENRETAIQYEVKSIPTLILFKGGQVIDRMIGFKSKNDLKAFLNKHI